MYYQIKQIMLTSILNSNEYTVILLFTVKSVN